MQEHVSGARRQASLRNARPAANNLPSGCGCKSGRRSRTAVRESAPARAPRRLLALLLASLGWLPLAATAQLGEGLSAGGLSGAQGSNADERVVAPRLPGSQGRPSPVPTPAGVTGAGGTHRNAQGAEPIDRIIAVVNQGVITETELRAQLHLIEARLRANGGSVPPQAELRRQVLEQMILQLAQEQFAAEHGMKPSAAEIDRAAADVAQNNGMSLDGLRERLAADGVSFEQFRRQLTAEIISLRLRDRETANSVTISEAEVDAELAKSGQMSAPEFEVQQLLVKLPEGADRATVERLQRKAEGLAAQARQGEDFSALVKAHSEAGDASTGGHLGWRTAEQMPGLFADVVTRLSPGEVGQVVRSPAGFHVLKLLDKRSGGTMSVERTHARHILLPAGNPSEEADSIRRLEEFRRNIEGGKADFATVARDFSKDGSASQGGDLGWLYPGETVPEFESAMKALGEGEISEPIRSQFGVHLIQVLGRRADSESPERLRNNARQKLRTVKGGEAYDQWLRELRDRTYVEYRQVES
ncbi:MAG: peptidylprolyl isomerase [Lautropia sp.]|nr:peptidylprolyl isomerase [Lautropia sp.]